ncbi:MAG: hypothetical protein GY835_14505 [bacterium]|nr:hypothetical protein [bacterium]
MLSQKFECVEPEIGKLLDARPMAEYESGLREQLEAHIDVCHACRQHYRFSQEVEQLIGEGVGVVESDNAQIISINTLFSRRSLLVASALALVASILLAILFGPSERALLSPRSTSVIERSPTGDFQILHPFEGEVLGARGGNLKWTPVDGATSYRVELKNVETDFSWFRQVNDTSIELPESGKGPGNYLAVIKPIPEDLTREGERSVYFRRGNTSSMLFYRIVHMPLISLLALVLGVAAGLLALRRF